MVQQLHIFFYFQLNFFFLGTILLVLYSVLHVTNLYLNVLVFLMLCVTTFNVMFFRTEY